MHKVYALITKGRFRRETLLEKAKVKDPGFDLYWLGVAFERIKTFHEASPGMLLLLEPFRFHDLLTFFDGWRQDLVRQLEQ